MATSFIALLDNMAALMRQTAIAAKTAGSSVSGLFSEGLADQTRCVTGIDPKREIPIVARLLTRSLTHLNSWILPTVLTLSGFFPEAIPALGVLGGLYFTSEGLKNIDNTYFKSRNKPASLQSAFANTMTPEALEQKLLDDGEKTGIVSGNELAVIALSSVSSQPLLARMASVATVTNGLIIGMHIAVMGLVKLDDFGLSLSQADGATRRGRAEQRVGHFILKHAPKMTRYIAKGGTFAMVTVGGNMLIKNIPFLEAPMESLRQTIPSLIDTIPYLHESPMLSSLADWGGTWGLAFACNVGAGLSAGLVMQSAILPPLKLVKEALRPMVEPFLAPVRNKMQSLIAQYATPVIEKMANHFYRTSERIFEKTTVEIRNIFRKYPAEEGPLLPVLPLKPALQSDINAQKTGPSELSETVFPKASTSQIQISDSFIASAPAHYFDHPNPL